MDSSSLHMSNIRLRRCVAQRSRYECTRERAHQVQGTKVDLLICCGDFQCLRNSQDFHGLACPDKYKTLVSIRLMFCDQMLQHVSESWIALGISHAKFAPLVRPSSIVGTLSRGEYKLQKSKPVRRLSLSSFEIACYFRHMLMSEW